jgi:4-amino-4-deoxy-L-arabinose transferase-like glycosyltransferase
LPSSAIRWCEQRYSVLAVFVLAFAAFNVFFRLDREIVTEWDESLYAISAAETAANGTWLGTTFEGRLDYYNTKPPLNVWLIAAAFKTFGPALVSLRLHSAVAAWLTILVLMLWARHVFGRSAALLAALILSTTFGFLYVHSGRSGNTDALYTLLLLLSVLTLWAADDRPGRLIWLGPLAAAVFLLRGTAVLMPLTIITIVLLLDARRLRSRAVPLAGAAVLVVVPVAIWGVARWHLDGWAFMGRMIGYDLIARATSALESHSGGPLYYLNVLQKDQFDWLLAVAAALLLVPPAAGSWWHSIRRLNRYQRILLAAWAGTTIVVPTLMQTKVAWYLNPFFPVFAVCAGLAIDQAFRSSHGLPPWRGLTLAAVFVVVLIAAESRLVWYSQTMRDVDQSPQGLILDERALLLGRRVFKPDWPHAERFVLEHVAGGHALVAEDDRQFVARGTKGDFMIVRKGARTSLACLPRQGPYELCSLPGPE